MDIKNKKNQSFNAVKGVGFLVGGVILGSLATIGVMISKNSKKAVDISDAVGKPILTVDGKTWTSTDLPGDSLMEYFDLEKNIFNARQGTASRIGVRIALAKDAGKSISSENLPKLEELLVVESISENDVKNYYDQLVAKAGIGVFAGKSYDVIKSQLQARMRQQKTSELLSHKIKELEDLGRIKVLLKPPLSPPFQLDLTGYPVRGNKNATTTLVEVADYLCSHCRESEVAIEKIYKEFSDKVKFVQVVYPIAPQGLSGSLARGAYCATEQGDKQFWDYHKLAFAVPFSKMQPPAGVEAYKAFENETIEIAKSANLDTDKFSTCLVSEKAHQHIQKVQNQFNETSGFSGTPSFYLNGRLIQVNSQQLASTLRVALN